MVAVATCRRSHLSPDGGGVNSRRCPPLGSGWLQVACSHLSPDGGGVNSRRCPPLGSGWLQVARSHLSPDGGGFTSSSVF